MESISFLNVLFLAAIALLVVVSVGIAYLTTAEWRDRRRQKRDENAR